MRRDADATTPEGPTPAQTGQTRVSWLVVAQGPRGAAAGGVRVRDVWLECAHLLTSRPYIRDF